MVTKISLGLLVLVLLLPIATIMPKGVVAVDGTILKKSAQCVCMCVAFRLDDVQDYFLDKIQKKIINTFRETNSSLTLGIIGNYIGEDDDLIGLIREAIKKSNMPQIEIAAHGWNHEDFTQFSKEEQSNLIKKANHKISSVLNTSTPIGFIPPYNIFNNDTISALLINNMAYISANTRMDPQLPFTEQYKIFSLGRIENEDHDNKKINGVERNLANIVYSFPSTATTGDLSSNKTYWYGEDYQQTLKQIKDSIDNYKFAVVLMHPQEYSIREGLEYENKFDLQQLNQLNLLLQNLKADGIKIVPLKDLNRC